MSRSKMPEVTLEDINDSSDDLYTQLSKKLNEHIERIVKMFNNKTKEDELINFIKYMFISCYRFINLEPNIDYYRTSLQVPIVFSLLFNVSYKLTVSTSIFQSYACYFYTELLNKLHDMDIMKSCNILSDRQCEYLSKYIKAVLFILASIQNQKKPQKQIQKLLAKTQTDISLLRSQILIHTTQKKIKIKIKKLKKDLQKEIKQLKKQTTQIEQIKQIAPTRILQELEYKIIILKQKIQNQLKEIQQITTSQIQDLQKEISKVLQAELQTTETKITKLKQELSTTRWVNNAQQKLEKLINLEQEPQEIHKKIQLEIQVLQIKIETQTTKLQQIAQTAKTAKTNKQIDKRAKQSIKTLAAITIISLIFIFIMFDQIGI